MNAKELAVLLRDVLDEYRILEDSPLNCIRLVQTFDDAKVYLYYSGIVICCKDENGADMEFQVSIVRTK